MNPAKAIRTRCLSCVGGMPKEVRGCDQLACALHPYRMGRTLERTRRPLSAIRRYCLWCMNGQEKEIALCTSVKCPLHPHRKGRGDRQGRDEDSTARENLLPGTEVPPSVARKK